MSGITLKKDTKMKKENGRDSNSGKKTENNPQTVGRISGNSGANPKKSAEAYPGFDENMFPDAGAESQTGTRPFTFTKYRAVEMGLCVAAIILGLLYLYTDLVTLGLLLPVFSVGMAVITALRVLDGREAIAKNEGDTGKIGKAAAYFPAVFSAFLTVVVIIVTAAYFSGAAG